MKKIATVIAAAVVTAGLGFGAASASAATPAPAANVATAAAIQHNNATGGVQQAGFRIYIGHHYRRWHRRCYVVGYRRIYSYRYHRWFLRPVYRCYYRRF